MLTKEKDEELALFLEMRRRGNDKEKAQSNFLDDSDNLDASFGNNSRSSSVSKIPSRKTAAEKFLDSENDKSDYDWLLTPPRTPSVEMESQKTVTRQNGMPNARVVALKSRLTNIQEEPASRTNIGSKRITLPSALNSSNSANRRTSSTSATRPATPTGRATLPTTKPLRSSTPTSRATMPSSKPAGPPVRSSTPTTTVARSSTPIGRPTNPVSKSAASSSTPTRQMSTPASAPGMASAGGRFSSETKSIISTLNNPVPLRANSPATKSRPWKPNEIPGFSLEAPPNLRTSFPERPASASRGRPGGPNAQFSGVETGSKGRPRQQSCSPARRRATNSGSANGGRISMPSRRRTPSNGSDDVNPVLMGTKMVERLVNMRKLAPPKQDDQHPTNNSSSALDSTGFGRTLSKKSLDMALRHMDIRRSVPGKLRPLTSIPASSMYSVRSGGSTKSKTNSGLDSPHATCSNASSELSVNESQFFDRIETELVNDNGSERGNSSPTSYSGT